MNKQGWVALLARWKKSFIALGMVCIAFPAIPQVIALDSVAAIVNDDVILLSELQERYDSYRTQAQSAGATNLPPKDIIINQILDRLILDSIQVQEARLRGIVIEDEELTEAARTYAQSAGYTLDEFRERLEEEGVSYREFREELNRQMTLTKIQQAMVNRRLYISERDVKEFRKSPFFAELSSEEYEIGHILLVVDKSDPSDNIDEVRARAKRIVNDLIEGASFATTAAQFSASNTALEGGSLGWRKAAQIPSLFSDVVVELEIGETAEPLENSLGIHIIQLLDKRGAGTMRGLSKLVRHILIQPSAIRSEEAALELITDLKHQIENGTDFAELAGEYSDDPGTALAGGELGWTDGEGFAQEFKDVMTGIEVGVVSEPFQTDFGWHILEVQEQRIEDLSEEVLDNLALQALFEQRMDETLEQWHKEIRDEAFVKILQDVQ